VLVARVGRDAVLVVRSGERVRFERCEPERMAEALVWRLPDVGVADGEPFSVRHVDFHAPRGRAEGSVMRRSAGARPEGARQLDALLGARRVAVAKLYTAKRDDSGVRLRSDRWLTVLDLVDGRWALSVSQVRGERWINASPGTHEHIGARLADSAR
jgi:ESAT-6 protein secretion system EspG family protein